MYIKMVNVHFLKFFLNMIVELLQIVEYSFLGRNSLYISIMKFQPLIRAHGFNNLECILSEDSSWGEGFKSFSI